MLTNDSNFKMKAACLCIASIAAREVIVGAWPNFMQIMSSAATSEPYNKQYRNAAMITLGDFSDFVSN